jgi:uncharacterized protein (DUF433 family)
MSVIRSQAFSRRNLDIRSKRPLALSSDFAGDAEKVQWASCRAAHNDQIFTTCPQSSQLSIGLPDPCAKLWLHGSRGRACGRMAARANSSDVVPRLARITRDHRVMGGRPCIRSMRVTVATTVRLLAQGHSRQTVLEAYPYLDSEDLTEALAYAAWRAMEVDVEIGVT